jgi:MscS family membrane protein
MDMSLMAVAQKNEFVVPGRAPSVRFVAFGDSSLQFELLVWIVRPDIKRTAVSQINQAIYREFQKKGIEMPFPQRDIHIRTDK